MVERPHFPQSPSPSLSPPSFTSLVRLKELGDTLGVRMTPGFYLPRQRVSILYNDNPGVRDANGAFGGLETLAGLAATVGAGLTGTPSGGGSASNWMGGGGGGEDVNGVSSTLGLGSGLGLAHPHQHGRLPPAYTLQPLNSNPNPNHNPNQRHEFLPPPQLGTATRSQPPSHGAHHPHSHSQHAHSRSSNITLGTITNIDEDLTKNPIARTLAKERRTCKSFNGEVVWPPKVEAALVQGTSALHHYFR